MTAQIKPPEQSLFRFITDDDFRSSLENDLTELEAAKNAGAWKCVHVLAGSIIEAVLIDYLLAVKYNRLDDDSILGMDLGKCIKACQAERILDEDAEKICTVIKNFRNLIHPGRIKRLGERVDSEGAAMAEAIVKRIVGDVMKKRKAVYGPTAEEIAEKLLRHPQTTMLDAFLSGTNETERRLLLLKYLPDSLESSKDEPGRKSSQDLAFRKCYRICFDRADIAVKREAVLMYETALKTAIPGRIDMYENNFFLARDLQYLDESERKLILGHLKVVLNTFFLGACQRPLMEGIGTFLAPSDVRELFPRLLWGIGKTDANRPDVRAVWVAREYPVMSDSAAEEFKKQLEHAVVTPIPQHTYVPSAQMILEGTIPALKKLIEGLR
jgi:hypothetical protein